MLDKFQKYLDSDIEEQSFWNIDRESGECKRSADEIADTHASELLDLINRAHREPIEAADKGTAFNEIVDCIIEHRKSNKEGLTIETVRFDMNIPSVIRAKINGFVFDFCSNLCKDAAAYFQGSVCQHYCSSTIETSYGIVELYGYADEVKYDKVFDIKTTGYYEFGKFERTWQKHVYPYCLVNQGEVTHVSEFEYTVFELKGGSSRNPIIDGKMYKECYSYNHEYSTRQLQSILEQFIGWIECRRDLITDKKIFNGEN